MRGSESDYERKRPLLKGQRESKVKVVVVVVVIVVLLILKLLALTSEAATANRSKLSTIDGLALARKKMSMFSALGYLYCPLFLLQHDVTCALGNRWQTKQVTAYHINCNTGRPKLIFHQKQRHTVGTL